MIPFNRACLVGHELAYIQRAIASGSLSGEGLFTQRCEELLQLLFGDVAPVLLTSSCTDALEMCALLLNTKQGDEVIMPSYTFVSTANAFVLRGARPIFVDIDRHYLNIDPACVEEAVTNKTRAVVAVHYAGVPCDMDRLMNIAHRHGIAVVEDAAHALGAKFLGKPVGTFGSLATFSFHETKNVTCGEGGALVVNEPSLVERAHIIRDKGTNRRQFQRGEAAFYTWVDAGSSYVMSDILAAFLYAQLEQLEIINRKRMELVQRYHSLLSPLRQQGYLAFPDLPNDSSAHIFFILLESQSIRDQLRQFLRDNNITSVFHYQPLHLSPYVSSRWGKQLPLPVTENIVPRLLRLPLFFSLEEMEQERIAEMVGKFFTAVPH